MTTDDPSGDRSPGWVRIDHAIIDLLPAIGPAAFAVYAVLAKHADESGACWPSVARVAQLCGTTKRSVRRCLQRLVDAGLIEVKRRRSEKGDHAPNVYRLYHTPREHGDKKDPRVVTKKTLGWGQKRPWGGDKKDPRTRTIELEPLNKKAFDPLTVELPFKSERFVQTWGDFVEHRNRLKKPLTEAATERLFARFLKWGEPSAIDGMDQSIMNGWIGVFQPRPNGHPRPRPPEDHRPARFLN